MLLQRALMQLPEDKREILVLSRFQELKYEEIARLLGCEIGAVKVRVHRALQQLREIYLGLENNPGRAKTRVVARRFRASHREGAMNLNCQQIEELLPDYLQGALARAQSAEVEQHCRALRQLRARHRDVEEARGAA